MCLLAVRKRRSSSSSSNATAAAIAAASAQHRSNSAGSSSQQQQQSELPQYDGYCASFLWCELMKQVSRHRVRQGVTEQWPLSTAPVLGVEQAVRTSNEKVRVSLTTTQYIPHRLMAAPSVR
jgi:hypothetical protein